MAKGFRQIAMITVVSRILGMVRDMTFSYFLGSKLLMDTWVIAFKIPNLARRIFGEGALSSSLMPVYVEHLKDDRPRANQLANTVLTALVVLLMGIVVLSQVILVIICRSRSLTTATELMLQLAVVMLPYMILICTVATIAGILQAHRHFAAPALAPVVLNVVIISALMTSAWILDFSREQQLGFVAMGVLVAGGAQLLIQVPFLRAQGISLRPCYTFGGKDFRRVMLLMGPMVLGLTVTQINTLADDVIAKVLSGPPDHTFRLLGMISVPFPVRDGAVSSLFYAQRLYQFPLGVLGISLATAIFPVMSAEAAKKDYPALSATLARGMRSAVFVAIPATAGMLLVGRALVSAIFEHGLFTSQDSRNVSWTLSFYVIGLCGYFTQQLTTRAYFSMKDSKQPFYSALIAVSVNIVLNLTLIWFLRAGGLALATALCSYLQVCFLVYGLRKRLGGAVLAGLRKTLVNTLIATGVMTFAGFGLSLLLADLPDSRLFNTIRVGIIVACAGGVFLVAAKALRMEELGLLTGRGIRHGR